VDRVIDMERARELVADQTIWPKVRDFLWDFAPSIHGSWVDRSESLDVEKLGINTSSRIKRSLLDSLKVEPCFYDFPKDGWGRLPLLDGTTLESIAKWLGALACADSLRLVTGGADVRELKAKLTGIYPEVFVFSAYFKNLKPGVEKKDGESLADFAIAVGYGMLFRMVCDLPKEVLLRFRLKLPKTFSQIKPSPLKASGINLPLLLKLKFPEAYKLCCS